MEGYQLGGGRDGRGENVQGLKSIIGRYKIDRGMLRRVNGEAKELICTTHGHELNGVDCWREWRVLGRGRQRGGNRTTVIP